MKMVKKNWLLVVLIGVLVLIVGTGLLVKCGMERAAAEEILTKFPDRGVPRMNITLNRVTLEEINAGSKDVKYEGNEVAVYEGEEKTLGAENVRVKGRGNGTWVQEKKPYQIKFDRKVDMFGMGKARKWVLLANATDATNLRTATAFYLEEMLGMKPALKGEFVELYVDDEYVGLYYMTQAVEIGKTSVDLRDPMGVLVELDNLYWEGENYRISRNGDKLVLKDTKEDGLVDFAMDQFLSDYNDFEVAIKEKNYQRIEELVDVESFAKYYLLSEFTVNPDAYWTSFFMYKDGSEDKIHAGPGWDFDLAFANKNWGNWMGEEFYSPTNTMIRKREFMSRELYEGIGVLEEGGIDWHSVSLNLSRTIFDLMDMTEFREVVQRVFLERMKEEKGKMLSVFDSEADAVTVAALIDGEKWNKKGFEQETEMLKEWMTKRFNYFDEVYGGQAFLVGT